MKFKVKKTHRADGSESPEMTDAEAQPAQTAPEAAVAEAAPASPPPPEAAAAAPPSQPDKEAVAALNDQLLRLRADFDNYRKRTHREWEDIRRRAGEEIIRDLLPALDHMALALETARQGGMAEAMIEGFHLVHEQLHAALAKHGLEAITAAGQPFDPHLHEAVAHIHAHDVPEGVVAQQNRQGFKLGGKLLRPAQVIVSRGTPPAGETQMPKGD